MKHKTNKPQGLTRQGVISISSKGIGYVAIGTEKDKIQDPEIDFEHLNTALHGDTVKIILHPKGKGRLTAEVLKIISRAKTGFAGVLEPADAKALAGKKEHNIFFLKPDDTKMYTDILIPTDSLNNAKAGQKVFAEIVSWMDSKKAPIGKVVEVLGSPGDNNAEMRAIALEKGFSSELPHKVEDEAKKIKQTGINEKDYLGRRDFRKVLTFTIDPSDAKDFDDAISFREIKVSEADAGKSSQRRSPLAGKDARFARIRGTTSLYEIGIHIADVTHYVKAGSELDREARERGTSVYLVDRTIPMLPETLSNDLCSLVPHKDRLTMSAVFVMDKNAKVKTQWFGRTIIHSRKRFTYEEAESSIQKSNAPLHKELFILNNLAKKLNKERFAQGAMSLDQEEVKFVLDAKGVPVKVITKERGDSNKLIEEFMLLANKKVAEVLSPKSPHRRSAPGTENQSVSIYRVHDLPSKEKMSDLAFFLRSLGYKISLKDGIIPSYEINNLLKSLAGKNEENTVNRAVIRSMAKAVYSTENIGHYGLAFPYYTHFTSPIRRYPDMLVHRFMMDYLSGKKTAKDKLHEKFVEYEKIARIASEQEKRASDAERASIKYKQVEYMSYRVGQEFEGIVSGVTEWGFYVEEMETKCEGLVKARDLKDDFYIFNEKKLEMVGQKKKKKYRLGDKVRVKVKGVDLERKTIDYILA